LKFVYPAALAVLTVIAPCAPAQTQYTPSSEEAPAETEGPVVMTDVAMKAEAAYARADFAQLQAIIDTLSQPDQLTGDGRPKLMAVYSGLKHFVEVYNSWSSDLNKIQSWRKYRPQDYGPDVVEALVWRAWAWHVRGTGYADSVSAEGWKLFNEKLDNAAAVLDRSKERATRTPLWYQVRLGVARDLGADDTQYQAIFDEAVARFPGYLPLYLQMAGHLSPKWGGSYSLLEKFARKTAGDKRHDDFTTYTRIYWDLGTQENEQFDLFRDSDVSWSLMKAGFEKMMQQYPRSDWNLNAFASFACRAGDGPTYAALRVRMGEKVFSDVWASNYSVDVCDERWLKKT